MKRIKRKSLKSKQCSRGLNIGIALLYMPIENAQGVIEKEFTPMLFLPKEPAWHWLITQPEFAEPLSKIDESNLPAVLAIQAEFNASIAWLIPL